MTSETFEVDGQEVEVTQTADGFEVEPVEEEPGPGLYLRAECHRGEYGCEIPIDADFECEVNHASSDGDLGNAGIAWNTDDDVSDLWSDGGYSRLTTDELDGHASVHNMEIVVRE